MAIDATCLMRVQCVRRIICLGSYSRHGSERAIQAPVVPSTRPAEPWKTNPSKSRRRRWGVPEPPAAAKLSLFTDGPDKPTISTLGVHRSRARLAGRL